MSTVPPSLDGRSIGILGRRTAPQELGLAGRFAAAESMTSDSFREMLVDSAVDDLQLRRAFTVLPANFLRPAIVAVGLDPGRPDEHVTPEIADAVYGARGKASGPKRSPVVYRTGYTVGAVASAQPAAEIVEQIAREYAAVRTGSALR